MSEMKTKSVICGDHGGRFRIPVRRGRNPKACSQANPCDQAKTARPGKREAAAAERVRRDQAARGGLRTVQTPMGPRTALVRPDGTQARPSKVSRSLASGWCRCTDMGKEPHNRGIEGCKYHTPDPTITEKELPAFQAYYPIKAKNGQLVILHAAGCDHTAKWPEARTDIVKLDLFADDMRDNLATLSAPVRPVASWNEVGVSNCAMNHAKRQRRTNQKAAEKPSALTKRENPCVPLAHAAKGDLEPLGWSVKGRAGFAEDTAYAEVTATRGTELLVIRWEQSPTNPVIKVDQNYTLWNTERQAENRKPRATPSAAPEGSVPVPPRNVAFNPALIEDRDLIREIGGQRIAWHNRLGGNRETAVVSPNSIKIEHEYNSNGDTIPSERIIKFTDGEGRGFRALRLSQLLNVG